MLNLSDYLKSPARAPQNPMPAAVANSNLPHVLVIEDQEDLAALYENALRAAGYRVSNAYSGEEGIAEYDAEGADAVILDMTLPEMNGTTTLEELRRRNASLPVVVVTGETNEALRADCERLGVIDYLPKPPDYQQIINALSQAIELKATRNFEVVTVRLPRHIIESLKHTDAQIERAIAHWYEERQQHFQTPSSPAIETMSLQTPSLAPDTCDTNAVQDNPSNPARRSLLDLFKRRLRKRR